MILMFIVWVGTALLKNYRESLKYGIIIEKINSLQKNFDKKVGRV